VTLEGGTTVQHAAAVASRRDTLGPTHRKVRDDHVCNHEEAGYAGQPRNDQQHAFHHSASEELSRMKGAALL